MNKELIVSNLNKLLHFMQKVQDKEVWLNSVTKYDENNCGTAHCVFGWVGASELFKDQGVEYYNGIITFKAERISYCKSEDSLDPLFGPNCHAVMFQYAGDSTYDTEMGYPDKCTTGNYTPAEEKALAILRIKKQIELVEAM